MDEKEANKYAGKSSRGRAKPVKPKPATKSKPKEVKKKETATNEVKDEFAFSDDSSSKNGESQEVKDIIDDKESTNEVVSLADRLKKSVLSFVINPKMTFFYEMVEVCISGNPIKNITPSFLTGLFLNLKTVQAPVFRQFPSVNCFFVDS